MGNFIGRNFGQALCSDKRNCEINGPLEHPKKGARNNAAGESVGLIPAIFNSFAAMAHLWFMCWRSCSNTSATWK